MNFKSRSCLDDLNCECELQNPIFRNRVVPHKFAFWHPYSTFTNDIDSITFLSLCENHAYGVNLCNN